MGFVDLILYLIVIVYVGLVLWRKRIGQRHRFRSPRYVEAHVWTQQQHYPPSLTHKE